MPHPNMNEAIATLSLIRPARTFLTAKSGAGKSYMSTILKKHGFKVLELDTVVRDVGKRFGITGPKAFAMYKNGLAANVMTAFVDEIHAFFAKHESSPVVVEGAISDAGLITRIFGDVFTFIFLLPTDVKAYATRMMKRYRDEKKRGVRSLSIWPEVTPAIEALPLTSPKLRAFMLKQSRASMKSSKERFNGFVKSGFTIYRVDV